MMVVMLLFSSGLMANAFILTGCIPPAKYTDPGSPFYRYKHLTVEQRVQSLEAIFNFHMYVEEKGYVAIDFYDGSIHYDFINNETKIWAQNRN
ncbi:hypothetical protein JJQ72_01355 [Paenibacillus sp. F411]|nr:hypothetical protein [Paenibacillus sp. F411]